MAGTWAIDHVGLEQRVGEVRGSPILWMAGASLGLFVETRRLESTN